VAIENPGLVVKWKLAEHRSIRQMNYARIIQRGRICGHELFFARRSSRLKPTATTGAPRTNQLRSRPEIARGSIEPFRATLLPIFAARPGK
jgi:hypothetical protein